MAKRGTVVRSINDADGWRCVDVIEVTAGVFAFRSYRRDPEDPRGWGPLEPLSAERFDSVEAAMAAARARYPWLP